MGRASSSHLRTPARRHRRWGLRGAPLDAEAVADVVRIELADELVVLDAEEQAAEIASRYQGWIRDYGRRAAWRIRRGVKRGLPEAEAEALADADDALARAGHDAGCDVTAWLALACRRRHPAEQRRRGRMARSRLLRADRGGRQAPARTRARAPRSPRRARAGASRDGPDGEGGEPPGQGADADLVERLGSRQ
jgi:hypothetical protein